MTLHTPPMTPEFPITPRITRMLDSPCVLYLVRMQPFSNLHTESSEGPGPPWVPVAARSFSEALRSCCVEIDVPLAEVHRYMAQTRLYEEIYQN